MTDKVKRMGSFEIAWIDEEFHDCSASLLQVMKEGRTRLEVATRNLESNFYIDIRQFTIGQVLVYCVCVNERVVAYTTPVAIAPVKERPFNPAFR